MTMIYLAVPTVRPDSWEGGRTTVCGMMMSQSHYTHQWCGAGLRT